MIKKITPKDFALKVEENVKKYNLDYMDAILKTAEEYGIEDMEDVARIIKLNKNLKAKLELECIQYKLVEYKSFLRL